jgi:hypothetical protein
VIAALSRIPSRLRLLGVVLACWLAAGLAGVRGVEHSASYDYATSLLLGLGLFGATVGIDKQAARAHARLIVTAATVGVLCKALLIGGVLYLATRNPLFWVLGIAVAQIDPLSVATIMGDDRMTPRVKAILASWASFDDPITVILAIYATAASANSLGIHLPGGTGPAWLRQLGSYGLDALANLVWVAAAYLVWRFLARWPMLRWLALSLLAVIAVWQFLMLGIAVAGLFIRTPWLARAVGRVMDGALLVSGALLGLLLVNGVTLGYGIALGAMAFVAQIVVSTVLTRGLDRVERIHLALAQQNGITAIILALRLETAYPGVVAVVAPAIVVSNLAYFVTNRLADRKLATVG